ncbi:MAG: hypothetical protein ACTHOU_13720 [Aureliella sp.]
MELRWQPNFDVSAMHAAWAFDSGRQLVDDALRAELRPAVAELAQQAGELHVPRSIFWRQLLSLAADVPSNEQLAQRLFQRLRPDALSPHAVSRLAAAISHCEAIMRRRFPRMLEELALRIGPLRSTWEARGPGLLVLLGEATEPGFIVESATVLPVQPVVGGDGMAHLSTNRVHIELLLTDVDPRLPETLRLAWLLGQLNLDRPSYSEQVHGHALADVAELALLPAILSAAENVQLAQLDQAAVEVALSQWLRTPEEQLGARAQLLLAWWETATESQWPWNTSLAALAQMLT